MRLPPGQLLLVVLGTQAVPEEPPANYICDPAPAGFQRHGKDSAEPWPLCAPQFIVAGTEKGGTTSFYEYLKAHPDFLPVSGRYMFPKKDRARIIKTLIGRANIMESKAGVPKENWGKDNRHDRARWMRLANLTEVEMNTAEALTGKFTSRELKFPELESHAIPIRLGKEVRYWSHQFSRLLKDLDYTELQGYECYLNLFDAIPAPLPPPGASAPSESHLSRTWAHTRSVLPSFGLSSSSSVPDSLVGKMYKVSGEASPQYLERSQYMPRYVKKHQPNTRVLFLLREPVRRYWSQARMINGMKGRKMDPDLADFEINVKRCLGPGKKVDKPHHHSAKRATVPGGGGVARMKQLDWSKEETLESKEFTALRKDLEMCFSHGLAQFLMKSIYVPHLQRWLVDAKFPREQVLTLPSEQFFVNPEKVLAQGASFAGLRPLPDEVWQNATQYSHDPHFDIHKLEFSMRVTRSAKSKGVALVDGKPRGLEGMAPRVQKLLEEFYAGPNCALRDLLSLDWSEWGWAYCKDERKGKGSANERKEEL